MRLAVIAVSLILGGGVAAAQPSSTWWEGSRYWAVQKPLPDLRSPSPSLPPPPRVAEPAANGLIPNGDGTYRWEGLTFVANVRGDGTISFSDRGPFTWDPVMGGVNWDLTDAVMRSRGEDPYRYEKHKVMARTFERRAAMKAQYDRAHMRAALDDLPLYLFAVWHEPRWSPELRRRILFELWDECAEEGNSLIASGGAEARRTIEEFVRVHLPAGSPLGFTREELDGLNAHRLSRQGFAPYGAADTSRVAAASQNRF
jgi:hypothetical protein